MNQAMTSLYFNLCIILTCIPGFICPRPTKSRIIKAPKSFNLSQVLYEEYVHPDIIPYIPPNVCNLHYDIEEPVGNNTKIPFELIKLNPPKVTWPFKHGAKHTLAMIDLDNHSFEVYDVKEVFIWLVTDIPRNDIDEGRVVYSYFGDDHEPRRGIHRVLVLVYEQNHVPLIPHLDKVLLQLRWLYRIHEFALKYNLTTPPVAGNFFKMEVRRPRSYTKSMEFARYDGDGFSGREDEYAEGFTRSTIDLYLGVDPKIIKEGLRPVLKKIRAFITKVDRLTRFPTSPNPDNPYDESKIDWSLKDSDDVNK
ncbi:phosphatidylethanolamine-binding protein homolog F40A3.3-like [Planococcus citri]|uniref:phosphatidylethanolamine-binding protein homolog F40A3.3-like n=1 Tax=Planococcus citri TaxID=170843 RepID=UPI0031F941A4